MRILAILAALICLAAGSAAAAEPGIAPTGTLRAAYIASNLAQAAQDPTTGAFRGVSADIARELGRRNQVPVSIMPAASAAAVLNSVRGSTADIGFVAPNPERLGIVLYSQTYMLVQQSFLVRDGSPITSVAEIDRPGQTVAANTDNSVGVYLKSRLTQAKLIESSDYSLKEGARWLLDGTADAFAGNRQRLHATTKDIPGLHLLPDNLYGVPQTIAVATGKPELLAAINRAIDEMRASGFLRAAVERSGVDGIDVAPAEASR